MSNEKKELIKPDELRGFCQDLLVSAGIKAEDAEIIVDTLVEADLRGVHSHGVQRLTDYVPAMKRGSIKTDYEIEFQDISSSLALVDMNHGPGQVGAYKAMEKSIEIAEETGVGLTGVKNSGHFGMAAYYAEQAIDNDMIGISTTEVEVDMVPFGARKPFLGNSPLSIAIPAEKELPIVLDMATSNSNYGKILEAEKEGRSIPSDWGVDDKGEPTTDPSEVKGLFPSSGAKGSGLAIVLNILSSTLFGEPFSPDAKGIYNDPDEPHRIGHLLGAIDVSKFVPLESFKNQVDEIVKSIKSLEPAKGHDEVFLPGEIELREREKKLKEGIRIDKKIMSELRGLEE